MSKKDVYKTVKKQSQSLLIEKKSKFIANVKPVDNEDDALAFLNEMRSKYSDATHNVYAYVIDENNIFRYSDDGEPSGTAGMPVLDAIRKSGIVDVVVVVTRYFRRYTSRNGQDLYILTEHRQNRELIESWNS